ncbi:hypothetical protein [Paraburkholderia domus]|uniref:hypothetical protein n=1 Tax=Paraburkholderia domus TaxID=2793075 RepID=UPI0019136D8A|nr:hypothetical protein [Paraburkholderia domus]MBK5061805.1 hypothetical protein [Burkholderia sp. R-70199]CAE6900845.1 hypothetical protein R70199_03685 [Paraburkholderia domus]
MTEREQFEAWAGSQDFIFIFAPGVLTTYADMETQRAWAAWHASRGAAIKDAHSACLAGVKWSPDPSKQIQFYVNGTCHRLAAEISALASQPPQTEQTLTCALCGGCGPVVGCDACQSTGNIAMQPTIGTEGDPAC